MKFEVDMKYPLRVLVIGVGYVGIALIDELLKFNKFLVTGYDVSKEVLTRVMKTDGKYKEIDLSRLNNSNVKFTSDPNDLEDYDVYLICVPTPLLEGKPDLSMIREAGELISKIIKNGSLIILESTSYPGTTEDVLLPIIEKSNLKAGIDFFLAFGSERIDPGNSNYRITNTPKVIGGINKISTDKAMEFYSNFISEIIPAKGTREAELSKLLENTYRNVNIALVNEMAMICHELEIDVWDVIKCASSKPFGFDTFYPGPGVGGHCIPIDPLYLSNYVFENLNKNFELIDLSQKINSNMPAYVVDRIRDLLQKVSNKKLEGSKVLIVGASYKSDLPDMRNSPIFYILEAFIKFDVKFVIHDNLVDEVKVGSDTFKTIGTLPDTFEEFDLIVILQHHSDLDVHKLIQSGILLFDTRGKIQTSQKL